MTFGFSSLVDLLSWVAAALLGLKVAATVTLLRQERSRWFDSRTGAFLWWSTKVTPILAVPCLIAIALLERRISDAWVYVGLMAFVIIVIPLVVWNAVSKRSARWRSAKS